MGKKLHVPFLLSPAAKDYLWGGSRLNDDFGKNIDCSPLAETWECSTHPDGFSVVASGADAGKTLPEVLQLRPEYLGNHPLQTMQGKAELPVLIKLIDAKQKLSVQVHPDDDYALRCENSLGKTEMWYILDAEPDAQLIYGLKKDLSKEDFEKAIKDGTIEDKVNYVPVKRGDAFLIPAGTLHAIGSGIVLAEIQQSSDTTYRVYDYGRLGLDGNPRPLHIEKALQVTNLSSSVGEEYADPYGQGRIVIK